MPTPASRMGAGEAIAYALASTTATSKRHQRRADDDSAGVRQDAPPLRRQDLRDAERGGEHQHDEQDRGRHDGYGVETEVTGGPNAQRLQRAQRLTRFPKRSEAWAGVVVRARVKAASESGPSEPEPARQ